MVKMNMARGIVTTGWKQGLLLRPGCSYWGEEGRLYFGGRLLVALSINVVPNAGIVMFEKIASRIDHRVHRRVSKGRKLFLKH